MYGDCLKDSKGEKKHERQSDWQDAIAHKEGCQEPITVTKIDSVDRRPKYYDFGDELKTSHLSEDEFSHFSFPTIGFCDANARGDPCTKQTVISDLCREDRQKIAQLVTEVSRCREEQKEKMLQFKKMSEENHELKQQIGQLEKDLSGLRISLKYGDENLKLFNKSHAVKESYLKNQNFELQRKIKFLENEKTEMQQKIEDAQKQIEKLANVVYHVTSESKKFYKKYDSSKEKLKTTLEIISQLEAKQKESSNKRMECKSSQTNLELVQQSGSKLKFLKKDKKCPLKYSQGKQEEERCSSDEDSLISELFFIPKQKNHSKTKYFSDDES